MTKHKRLPTFSAVIDDFCAAPFRLFFLSACWVAVVGAISGWWHFSATQMNLQAFYFLQNFAGATYAGFLFTALPRWTHDATPLGKHMRRLWLLWLAAGVCALLSLATALAIMVFYWLFIIVLATWLVWKNRDSRQISMLVFVLSMLALTVWLSVKAWRSNLVADDWQALVHLNLLGVVLITFRISRVLGRQALRDGEQADSRFIPNPYYKNLAVWLFYLLIIVELSLDNAVVSGWLHLAVAGVMLGRLREWHFAVLLKQHYVRWLYFSLLLVGLGYAWRGLALIGVSQTPLFEPTLPMNLITGVFLLIAYQIFNTAGLRHSNRELVYPFSSRVALLCLLLAALSRSVALGLGGDYLYFAVYLPTALLAVAFLLYLPVFYRIFTRYPATVPGD